MNSSLQPDYSERKTTESTCKDGAASAELRMTSESPEPSCVSLKSAQSKSELLTFREEGDTSDKLGKGSESPEASCVKSARSMTEPLTFRDEPSYTDHSDQKTRKGSEPKLKAIFKELEQKVIDVIRNELENILNGFSLDYPECQDGERDQSDVRDGVLMITLHILRNMNHAQIANTLQNKFPPSSHKKFKSILRENVQKFREGISEHGSAALLDEIYTELYITEGGCGGLNNEHEVRQIETASRRPAAQERPIKCNDLFKQKDTRTVLTKGVAGIGKTVSVQKFILDWTEGKANHDVVFMFPLPFRELNLMKDIKFSMMGFLRHFFPDTNYLKPRHYNQYKMLFIFDGLDECRLPLNFRQNERLCDVTKPASVDVLLTNLFKGNLLPSALLWITSRPGAVKLIPPECVDQVTEVHGFSDPQKEEYFQKKINDQSLANKIVAHVKSSRSLYIMCHIPVFCWISATVLTRMIDDATCRDIPKTLTQMFTYFLIVQVKQSNEKYQGKCDPDPQKTRESILALGKLAFQQLEKGNLIFYEEDLRGCGVDMGEASVYSGVCTEIFKEEFSLHLGRVFSFVHLSVQEFLAALYTFLSFVNGRNVILEQTTRFSHKMSDFLNSAVHRALQSENGHLDLFLRFLLGLSVESNQRNLRGLMSHIGSSFYNKETTVEYIKEKIRGNLSPEKSINLFHCLNELNDHSLVQEVQTYLNDGSYNRLHGSRLSPGQWSALAFVLLSSEEKLDEFDLRKYGASDECLYRLLLVVRTSRKALLQGCNLTKNSCTALSSVLSANSSSLRELDLSNNNLEDLGVKLLSVGLDNPHCTLEILRLRKCNITYKGCAALLSALRSNTSSHLRELNLNYNNPGDLGLKLLSEMLNDPHCKLEKLELRGCNLTEESCIVTSSILCSHSSSLKELDLSYNKLQDSGVKLLSDGLENPHCTLEILRLSNCNITNEGCAALVSALRSNLSSHLSELELDYNELEDSGVALLSGLLKDPHCKLKTLQLSNCSITAEGCAALVSALRTNTSSHLRELYLNYNNPGDIGVKLFSDLLKDPHCKLETLQYIRSCRKLIQTEESR